MHGTAASRLVALAEGAERWALPVFCVTAFMRMVMHRRVFNPPSTVARVPPPGVAALSVRIGVSVHQFRTAASNYQL